VMSNLMILAQGSATSAPSTQPAPPGWQQMLANPMFLVLLVLVVFMFFMSSSKRKQERERQNVLSAMKRGDRVQTIGGIIGTIVDVREGEIVVKVDESSNTKIRFSRTAIARVLGDEKGATDTK
jgi:preprotein translocase subunit YajC